MAKGAHSKADSVYGELKEAILSGALEPGRPIDKAALCEKLGVSRFPVSAAVSRLAYDRLVDVAPQHGSFVARISLADCRERLFIRSALEGEIVAEAARRLPAESKAALEANIAAAVAAAQAGDRRAFYGLDVDFHHLLTAGLGMARASEVLDNLRVHLERARRLTMSPSARLSEVVAEHRAIAAAVAAGDPDKAREAMIRHLAVTEALIRQVAEASPEMFAP